MRRNIGVSHVRNQQLKTQLYQEKGNELNEMKMEHVVETVEKFKTQIAEFARKHKSEISRNSEFRAKFYLMCSKVGIDPLASNKGMWAELLGAGNFYYELGIQIVTIGISTRQTNGGLLRLDDLLRRLEATRGRMKIGGTTSGSISVEDVRKAVEKLRVLGTSYAMCKVGGEDALLTVPVEVSSDHLSALDACGSAALMGGRKVSEAGLAAALRWDAGRARRALNFLHLEGFCWFDEVDSTYYFPSLMNVSM